MARMHEAIDDTQRAFIAAQRIFFVGSAPLDAAGHVNLSPKGLDSFPILGSDRVADPDPTGSGNETSAHLRENGRITSMFRAFDGPPNILRRYGRGEVTLPGSPLGDELRQRFGDTGTARGRSSQTSCRFAVPHYEWVGDRDTLTTWATVKGEAGLADYRRQKTARSIDGLVTPLGEAGG